jgi:hypothetical protein
MESVLQILMLYWSQVENVRGFMPRLLESTLSDSSSPFS